MGEVVITIQFALGSPTHVVCSKVGGGWAALRSPWLPGIWWDEPPGVFTTWMPSRPQKWGETSLSLQRFPGRLLPPCRLQTALVTCTATQAPKRSLDCSPPRQALPCTVWCLALTLSIKLQAQPIKENWFSRAPTNPLRWRWPPIFFVCVSLTGLGFFSGVLDIRCLSSAVSDFASNSKGHQGALLALGGLGFF